MSTPLKGPIDLAGLLSIDVASELRKLSQAQLQGPWQIPAELVRRAIRSGAKEVRLQTERHGVRMLDDGRGIEPELLQWCAVLLDERRSSEERHAALTTLESAGELALLALAGLEHRSLRIESTHRGTKAVLEVQRGRSPWLQLQEGFAGTGVDMTLRSPGLDRRQVAGWLRNAARFAPITVSIDGKPVDSGFSRALVQGPLTEPLQGRVAIPLDGDTAHVWLLEHGLVTGHVTIPEAPCLEAAVELGSEIADLSPSRLRDAVAPHVPVLVEQAVGLLVALGRRGPLTAEPVRSRAARLMLQAAQKKLALADIVRVPVFRSVDAHGQRLVDLVTLRKAAQPGPGGMRILPALYPTQNPDKFALGSTPVLIADAVERSRLAELLQVRFRPPDAKDAANTLHMAWRRRLDALSRAAARAASWLRHPLRSPPLSEDELEPTERHFLTLLQAHLRDDPRRSLHGAALCRGAGPIRRTGGASPRLLLPRDNPTVRAAVAAVARESAWIYPAALALLEGRDLPSAATRSQWLSALGSG